MNPRYPFPKNDPATRARHARFVVDQLAKLPESRDWLVEIKPLTKDRTSPQNRYLHAMLGEIAKESGHTPDEVKEALCRKFLGSQRLDLFGESVERRRSTTTLNTTECAALCDQIRAWAAEQGLILPLPEEFGC